MDNDEELAPLSPAERKRRLYWCSPMLRGLLFSALTDDWNAFERLCSWLEVDLEPEYDSATTTEEQKLVILIASHVRSEPMQGIEKVVAQIQSTKKKRPKLLLQIWQAIEARSQERFDEAMRESLTHFSKKKYDPKSADFTDPLALEESLMSLIALHFGMQFPKLSDKLAARLIRPETIGLRSS